VTVETISVRTGCELHHRFGCVLGFLVSDPDEDVADLVDQLRFTSRSLLGKPRVIVQ
jgi:hypothetical protein